VIEELAMKSWWQCGGSFSGNVGGSFSGNEELVAGLMAECDGKNGGNRILVAKGVATLHGKN